MPSNSWYSPVAGQLGHLAAVLRRRLHVLA